MVVAVLGLIGTIAGVIVGVATSETGVGAIVGIGIAIAIAGLSR